jgi:hypothetical protein
VKLTGRIPVEPLDEERLTRIERKIVAGAAEAAARPTRAWRASPVLAFAAAAVVAVGAGAVGWKLRGGGAPARELASAPLEVRSDAQRTTLDLGDARITNDPATAFTVTRPAGGVLVALARGKVALDVGKRGDRPALVVRAGDTEVVVVGTQFSVDYGDGTGDVDVRVTEGAVRVVRHQQETRVAAGQAWTTRRGLVALAEAGAGKAGAGGAGAGGAGASGAGGVDGGPDRDGKTIDDPARPGAGDLEIDMSGAPSVLRDRVASVPDVRAPQPGGSGTAPRGGAPGASAGSGAEPVGLRRSLDARAPQGDLKALIRAQPVLPALDVGEPNALEAMAAYRSIMTREKGPTEAHAFYSMAVIQALKLGRTADALGTLAAFKRRAPTSEYLVPALWLEVRIRCLRSIDDACRGAAETYARRAPQGPALHVAEKIGLTK